MHWYRDLIGLASHLFQVVLQDHLLAYVMFARPTVCKGTHLLSVTMVLLPLSLLMPYTASNNHRTIVTQILTILDGRATLTLLIWTLLFNLIVLCSHLGSNIEPLITSLLNPHNQNPTWRVLWSALFRCKWRLMKFLESRSTSWLPSLRLCPSTRRRWTARLLW